MRRVATSIASAAQASMRSSPQTVYLTHVKWVTGKGQIEKYFRQFGPIRNVNLFFDPQTGLHRGFASLTFENADSAAKAMEKRPHVIDGDRVNVDLFIPLSSKTKIFSVKNDEKTSSTSI